MNSVQPTETHLVLNVKVQVGYLSVQHILLSETLYEQSLLSEQRRRHTSHTSYMYVICSFPHN